MKRASCLAICALSAVFVKPVQDRIDAHSGTGGPDPDLLYFSSPAAVRTLALGYDNLVADLYWMRTIQYFGRRDEAAKRLVRFKNLYALLDITTSLNPNLLDAYRAGGFFLAEPEPTGAGEPGKALALLDKGIGAHPSEWRLYYDKGFVDYWFLKDYRRAADVWLSASRIHDAPPWMASLSAMAYSWGGAIETAEVLWQVQYRESPRADIRENARKQLLSIRAARELRDLAGLIRQYRARNGSLPGSLQELAASAPGPVPTADPLGTPFAYDRATGEVRLGPQSALRSLKID